MQYTIGQKFSGEYPPDAAIWCNENRALIVATASGEYEIQAVPTPTAVELFAALRLARDAKLQATDKTLLPDYPITADGLAQVKAYRTALRELPDQAGAPWDGGGELTPWPELPKT